MPQPIHMNDVTIVGDLTDEMYCAIGSVARLWNRLEFAITLAISKFCQMPFPNAVLLASALTAKGKVDLLGGTADLAGAEVADVFHKIADEVQGIARNRNKIVHGMWLGKDAKGRAIKMDVQAQKGGGRLIHEAWTQKDLGDVGRRCDDAFRKITYELVRLGLWDGKTFS